MKRSVKIGLGVLLIASLAAGYAVYWWHEISLDRQAVADNPTEEHVARAAEVRKLLVSVDARERQKAGEVLEPLSERDRERVLYVLSEDSAPAVRLAAIPLIRRLKDRVPAARATLVRLAVSDADKEVREAAKEALGGGR